MRARAGFDGTVALSSALRYDATARALRLEQPRAERLELQGRVLRNFMAEELRFGNKTCEIGDITVLADGIKFDLR